MTIYDNIRQYTTIYDNVRQYTTIYDNIRQWTYLNYMYDAPIFKKVTKKVINGVMGSLKGITK